MFPRVVEGQRSTRTLGKECVGRAGAAFATPSGSPGALGAPSTIYRAGPMRSARYRSFSELVR